MSRSSALATNAAPLKRCAVYTRKSSEHGLEQDFNSLDAKREAGESYIKSQAHEGCSHPEIGSHPGSGIVYEGPCTSNVSEVPTRRADFAERWG